VLRIRDVFPGSRIRLFSFPDPGFELFPSRIRIKELKYSIFNPKKWFLSSRKYDPGCSFRILDADPDFLPIPDSRSRGQKGTGSRIRIRNTGYFHFNNFLPQWIWLRTDGFEPDSIPQLTEYWVSVDSGQK
jgi:hypothetical protein